MFSLFLHSKNTTSNALPLTKGFGLIELMVSISIMALVSGIILTRHNSFNSAVLLRSQAYEVALQLRDLQLNAVSSTFAGGEGAEVFRDSLGAYFDTSVEKNSFFMIFRDASGNGFPNTGEEFGQKGILDQRFEIVEIRVVTAGGVNIVSSVSILFQRPNFDALFYASGAAQPNALSVEIDVARKGAQGRGVGVLRTIEVTSAGQISVKAEN